MILHLMIDSKMSEEFIKYIQKNFDISKHDIIIWRNKNSHNINLKNLKKFSLIETKKDLLKFYLQLFELKKYEKIIIHGWYFPYLSLALFFNFYLLKKVYWRIWGADNTVFLEKKYNFFSLKSNLNIFCDRFCKKRVKTYLMHMKEEYESIQVKYNVKGGYMNLFYPDIIYREEEKVISYKNKSCRYCIQIGNSAQEKNHLEILKKLIPYKENIETIYCPLSYGDSNNYIDDLLKKIPGVLKDKFRPILKILPFNEYIDLLSKMNIGIFPFKRQHAFGNISALIRMKKTVYLDENSLTYKYFEKIGVKIKQYNTFDNLEVFNDEILEKNKNIMKEMFSEENLLKDLEEIFGEKRQYNTRRRVK